MMEAENKMENGCKIFCIFFKNEKDSDCKKGKENANKIANIGGTKKCNCSKTLNELSDASDTINRAIKIGNFGLKLS